VQETTDTPRLELGHALITMIEPEPATIVEYNDWYEGDHSLAGVMTGPGAFSMRRFVATRDLKALRTPADSPVAQPLTDGSFIALYWFERDQIGPHCDWGFPETARLASAGRMRGDRRHLSTTYYDLVSASGRGAKPVPPELALANPAQGLIVIYTQASEDHEPSAATLRDALVADGSKIGSVISFRPSLPPQVPQMPGAVIDDPTVDDDEVMVHCCFVDTVTDGDWPSLVDQVNAVLANLPVTTLLVAPFVPTVPGTDTYLDQLW